MKKLFFALLYQAGVTRLFSWYYRKRVVFVCYHGVTENVTRDASNSKGLHVNAQRFARHMDFLQKRYHLTSLKQFIKARHNGDCLPDYSMVLTFDDGFRNFLTVAAPILAARKIPATVFLITDKAAERNGSSLEANWSSEDDRRYLSWGEAKQLQRQGFEFGSHTCSHPGLLTISAAESRHELKHSRDDLVNNLEVDTPALSYPKGQYSDLLAVDASKVGYACAVTTDRGLNEFDHDLFTLGRALIGDFDDEASLAVRVSGLRWMLVQILSVFRPSRPASPVRPVAPVSKKYPGKIYEVHN